MTNLFALHKRQPLCTLVIAVFLAQCFQPGTTSAQSFTKALATEGSITINAGTTICQPSGTTVNFADNRTYWPNWPSSFPDYTPSMVAPFMADNTAAYHKAVAGGTKQIIVDITNIGDLQNLNPSLIYSIGYIDGSYDTYEALVGSPDPGIIRFIINADFTKPGFKGYIAFVVHSGSLQNGIKENLVVIPFVVEGITMAQVPILGTTVVPQLPYLVLHAPPGDESSSEFQQSKTTCRELVDSYAEDNSNTANAAVKLGTSGSIGFIATVDYEFSVTVSGGVTSGGMVIKTSGNQTCVTVNEGFSTTELTGTDGGGDVFIGYGTDMAYGVYPQIIIDQATCSAKLDTGLIYTPVGQPRNFALTKTAIFSEIETLEDMAANSSLSDKERIEAANQMDVWKQVLVQNDSNIVRANESMGAVNFSSGVNSFYESSITVTDQNSIQYEQYIEKNIGVESVVELNGSGASGGYEYKSSRRYGATQNQTQESSKLVKYTLADNDTGDNFNLNVVRDPMFGTPVFRINPGTKSSCPWQGGDQRDKPDLRITGQSNSTISLQGIPAGSSATFSVEICNNSDEQRSYQLRLNTDSNPGGAVVTAGGVSVTNAAGPDYPVQAHSCKPDPVVVEVRRVSQQSVLDYPNLEIFLEPVCADEENISSSIFASVYFTNTNGTTELADNNLLSVFPNPTSGILSISLPERKSMETIQLMDFSGRNVRQLELSGNAQQYDLDLSGLPRGIYGIQVGSEGQVFCKKVVLE